jgi:hypothetical protein
MRGVFLSLIGDWKKEDDISACLGLILQWALENKSTFCWVERKSMELPFIIILHLLVCVRCSAQY